MRRESTRRTYPAVCGIFYHHGDGFDDSANFARRRQLRVLEINEQKVRIARRHTGMAPHGKGAPRDPTIGLWNFTVIFTFLLRNPIQGSSSRSSTMKDSESSCIKTETPMNI